MMLHDWALQWRIPHGALVDLQARMAMVGDEVIAKPRQGESEGAVQAAVMLEAPTKGVLLFRNNVGVLKREDGVPVRFGLANQSAAQNKVIKSADLVGIRRRSVAELHAAGVEFVGQFVSREVKEFGWRFTGTERELAQLAWADLILSHGGDAAFAPGVGTL